MRALLFFSVLIFSLSVNSQSVTFDWVRQLGGTSHDQGNSITADASGNIYTTGKFMDTVDFDPGIGTFNLISNGNHDVFIQKLDANGNLLWVKQMGGLFNDSGNSIAVDGSGSVLTTGVFGGTVDFDPGAGVSNLTGGVIFIQKLDANGNFQWAKQMRGTGNEHVNSISVDGSGNVYTTGFFSDTVDFNPGAGVNSLTSNGGADIFIQKLDANGNFLWVKQMGGTGFDSGKSVAVDYSGNVYSTGYFTNTVDFDPSAGVFNLMFYGGDDIFIQKLDTSGNFLWVKQMGGPDYEYGNAITLDGAGNVYTTGSFRATVDFNPGSGVNDLTSHGSFDIFIQNLDSNGNFIWVKQMGGTSSDYGTSLIADGSSSVYTTGGFSSTIDFDPGVGMSELTSNGDADIFIQKLDASGNFHWVKQIGSTALDEGLSVTLDTNGNVYTTGYFKSTADFDPGPGVSNLTPKGGEDVFILKLNSAGIDIIENNFSAGLLLYPNPTQGNFSIDLGENYSILSISVIDITGKLIQSMSSTDLQVLNLKLEEPAGVYFLILESEEKRATIRLVKE